MFSNYFFLKRLAESLNEKLIGFELLECFSQNKDEVVFGFAKEQREFWIRANLDPNISLLCFPPSISRAKRNSVDLFTEAIGTKVSACSIFHYERSFQLSLENGKALIFKMHGRRANLLLSEGNQIVKIFRKSLTSDLQFTLDQLHKHLEISEAAFAASGFKPTALLPALGKEADQYWRNHFEDLDELQKWKALQNLLHLLEANPISLLQGDSPKISLLSEEKVETTNDPIEASNWLYEKKTRSFYVDREKNQLLSSLKQQVKKSENYIFKTSEKLRVVAGQRSPEEVANIIMANLHIISTGTSKVVLDDIYQGGLIDIKLSPTLSPQKNAENLYRKSKNRHQEIDTLKRNIAEKEQLIEKLREQMLEIEQMEDIRELRKQFKPKSPQNTANKKELPYHEFTRDGWLVFVGKNAKANDELTLKVAKKNDLWLHAKDVSGSHVVIRQKPGQNFPTHIIEYAAGLAALNSKRKSDTLCPVVFTPKKFVRKVKGSLPGQVMVDKEEVVLVAPAQG